MDEIATSTTTYLEDKAVIADLKRVAHELAEAWRARRQVQVVPESETTSTKLETVPENRLPTERKLAADHAQAVEVDSGSVSDKAAGEGRLTPFPPWPGSEDLADRSQPHNRPGETAHGSNNGHVYYTTSISPIVGPKVTYDGTAVTILPDTQHKPEKQQQAIQDYRFPSTPTQDDVVLEVPEISPNVTPDPSRDSSVTRSQASKFHVDNFLNLNNKISPQKTAA